MYDNREDVRCVEVKIRFSEKHAELIAEFAARSGKQRATFIHDLCILHIFHSLNEGAPDYDKSFD